MLQLKRGWIALVCILLLAGLALGLWFGLHIGDRRRAERLYRSGDFTAAREYYLRAGDEAGAVRCEESIRETRYHRARQAMQAGDYALALENLVLLGDYQDSRRLIPQCRFLYANALRDAGELDEAKAIYLALGDYPGCGEALEGLPPLYYDKALSLARGFELEGACTIWEQLGDYRNCPTLLHRGRRILEQLADSFRTKLNDPSMAYRNRFGADAFACEEGYIVAPAHPDARTRVFLYVPGGRNEELNLEFLEAYLANPAPNTLAVFLRKNALPDLAAGSRRALDLLEAAATDFGVFVDEPVVAGSSLGVYPALQLPRFAWHEYGVRVSCVLSLDAGNDWWEPLLVPDDTAAEDLARIGTELYLFQSPDLGTEHQAIQRLANAGNVITIVECVNDEHERISLDALSLGIVEWAVGDRIEPFPDEAFRFWSLTR